MKVTTILILSIAALVGFAGDGQQCSAEKTAKAHATKSKQCTADAQACVSKHMAKFENVAWDGIRLEGLGQEGQVATVTEIVPESPAALAGLQKGDVLISMNGNVLASMSSQDLGKLMSDIKVGDEITFAVQRDGQDRNVTLTSIAMPDNVKAFWIGQHMMTGHADPDQQVAVN